MKQTNRWTGRKQIAMLLYFGILFLICACVNAGMTNTILPSICELRGWEYADVLPFMSYGGYVGAVATLVFAQLVVKWGAKLVIVLGLALGGVSLILYGSTAAFAVFVLTVIGNRVFSCAYQQAGATALLNNWFPRTKGIVLGWATMGIILADVIWSPYIPRAIAAVGAPLTMTLVAIVFFALAAVSVFLVRNTPEEAGTYPDNDASHLQKLAADRRIMQSHRTSFTWGKLLRTPQVWQIGIGWGLLWMIAVAFVSQLVNRCISIGYEASFAIRVLQIASIVALAGSWLFGFLDQKLGTKPATLIYAAAIAIFFVLGLLQPYGQTLVWISACGIMACVGGIANLAPSMIGTVFGRWDFAAANRLISPIIMAVSSSAFLLASVCLKTSAGYNGMYIICAVIAALCFVLVAFTKDTMIGAAEPNVL